MKKEKDGKLCCCILLINHYMKSLCSNQLLKHPTCGFLGIPRPHSVLVPLVFCWFAVGLFSLLLLTDVCGRIGLLH